MLVASVTSFGVTSNISNSFPFSGISGSSSLSSGEGEGRHAQSTLQLHQVYHLNQEMIAVIDMSQLDAFALLTGFSLICGTVLSQLEGSKSSYRRTKR